MVRAVPELLKLRIPHVRTDLEAKMIRMILRQLFYSFLVLIFLTLIVFTLSNMITGNEIDVMRMDYPEMTQETYDALVHERGLDRPIIVRYWDWLTSALHGDLGMATTQNKPVTELLAQRLGPTLLLSGTALLFSILLGLPLGIISAYRPYSIWDNISSAVAFISSAVPGFILCLFGIYFFSVRLNIFPTSGMYTANSEHTVGDLLWHLALPAMIAGFSLVGNLIKQTRSAVLEVINENYIRTARSKGLGEFSIVIKHAMRNAMIPIITTISLSVPFLVGGSVVIEEIFSWPGMGSMIISSINSRDYNPVLGATLLICITVLIVNFCIEFVYMLVDPRLRKEQ